VRSTTGTLLYAAMRCCLPATLRRLLNFSFVRDSINGTRGPGSRGAAAPPAHDRSQEDREEGPCPRKGNRRTLAAMWPASSWRKCGCQPPRPGPGRAGSSHYERGSLQSRSKWVCSIP
jgi:hypothetical protein